jgi:hypothetical protein
MTHHRLSMVSTFIALAAAAGGRAQTLDKQFPLLSRLSISESELPPKCSIPDKVRFPIEGAVNRRITTDSRAFVLVVTSVDFLYQRL